MSVGGILRRVDSTLVLCVLGLLLLALPVTYGFDYECLDCLPPECICPSADPPGGLDPTNTPQMILITFDDAVNQDRYEVCTQILTNHYNPNGTPIQATFFVDTTWIDYWYVGQLHAQGHEIALHSMTHTTDSNTTLDAWRSEIYGGRQAVSELSQIPLEEIVGFRAPHLAFNSNSFQALSDAGFEYDASVKEVPGYLSTNGSTYIWPYTLDNGLAQNATTGLAPTGTYPGLFEVPIWVLLETNGDESCTMDCPQTGAELLDLLQRNFTNHYYGNRAPLEIAMHTYWFTGELSRVTTLNQFISWALTNHSPNVWFVSTHSLVEFMRSPVDIASASSFPPFVTATNTICPIASAANCRYGEYEFSTCFECPPAYPEPDTVFNDACDGTGGVVWIDITPYSSSYDARLYVSNNTGRTMVDWTVTFELGAGYLDGLWGGNFETNGQQVTVWPVGAKRPIAAGEVQSNIAFYVNGTGGSEDIDNLTLTMTDLTPMTPLMESCAGSVSNELMLSWDCTAVGYAVLFSSNINAASWQPLTEIYGRTSTVVAPPPEAASGFYRLKTLP